MLSHNTLRARHDPPPPPPPPSPPPPSPPPPNGHIHGRPQGRRNPGVDLIFANKAVVVAPPAGAAPPPPPPSRSSPFNLTRPGFRPPIPFKPFIAAQRLNGSAISSPLRRGHSIAASIPTASESASSSGDGDREDDSEASSSDVEHIRVPGRPVPGILRLPPSMGDPSAHPQGPWPPPGSSFSRSAISAPRFTPLHRLPNRSSRSASSGTTPTRGAPRRIWADVAHQRSKVLGLRETLRKKRIDLQARRRQTDRADNEFMQVVRPLLVSALSTVALSAETIRERLQVLQGAREAYYGAENAYVEGEAELGHQERRLQKRELALQQFLDGQRGNDNDDSSYGTADDDKEESSSDYDKTHVNNNHSVIHSTHENDTKQVSLDTGQNKPLRSDVDRVHDSTDARGTRGSDLDHVNNNANKRDGADPTSNPAYFLLGIDGDRAEDIHPLYHELLNAAADRELAREHHTEMNRRHDRIMHELEMDLHRERARANRGNQLSDGDLLSLKSSLTGFPPSVEEFKRKFGIPVDPDDLEFLHDYPLEVEAVRRVMEEAEQEVVWLKALCEEKGAMRKNPPYEEEFTILKGTSMASRLPEGNMALSLRPAPNLSHPIFSTLLSNPMHVLEQKTPMEALKEVMRLPKDSPGAALGRINCMKELGISNLMQKPKNKTDFINQWLIHRLRTSPMEVELLFSISTGFLRIMSLRRWQEDVLVHWKTDDAAGTLGPSLARSWTTNEVIADDDDTGESDGSDDSESSHGSEGSHGSYGSDDNEVDESDLDSLRRARSEDEGSHSHSRRNGSKVEASTKSSPFL